MSLIKNLAIVILAIIVGATASWLSLWIANILAYILSLPTGFIGMMIDAVPDGIVKFVKDFITYGLPFGFTFYLAQSILTVDHFIFMEESPWLTRMVVILLTISMIFVLDYRFDPLLPQLVVDGMDFLREECGVYLVTPFNWVEVLDEASELGDIEHTVCDITIGLGGTLALFYNHWEHN